MGYIGPVSSVVTLNGSVANSLPSLGTGQTLISKSLFNSATGSTIHTTTAGKTFYCLGLSYQSFTPGSNASVLVDGTMVLAIQTLATANLIATGGIIFSCPATKSVTHVTGAGNANVNMWGYEA